MLGAYRDKKAKKQKLMYSAYKSHKAIPLFDDDEEEERFQLKRLRSEGGTLGSNMPIDINTIVKHEKL